MYEDSDFLRIEAEVSILLHAALRAGPDFKIDKLSEKNFLQVIS